ncbi:MAG TPA: hypothetical protein VGJ78_12375 [Vicinamibacterales bacterium]
MLLVSRAVAVAQIVVHDRAVTFRNSVTAIAKEYLLHIQQEQHRQLRRMAQRLSLFTSLDKYTLPDPPRWRTHGGNVLFTRAYSDALTVGDADGTAYLALSHPLASAHEALSRLNPTARRALMSRLATIDLADATAIAGTHDTGQLRFNGRTRELPAIDALEAHVVDPSNERSATAVLDTISGAVLIGARQRQARTQLLTGIVEQLLVESKRARDADAAALNMQLTVWRDAQAANDAFVAGSGDALRTWRQP